MHTKRLSIAAFRAIDLTTAELGKGDNDEEEGSNDGEEGGESIENRSIGWSRATKSENISVFIFRDPRECSIEHGGWDLGCRSTHDCVVGTIDEKRALVEDQYSVPNDSALCK